MKRCIDFTAALLGLAFLSPLLLAIAAFVKFTSRGPVFYLGRRVGLNGEIFRMCKFRTMVENADQLGGSCTAEGDPRITPAGDWLRKFKLDELPQLFNVLGGDMSLVGPRPEVEDFVRLFTPEERAILSVRPGITDWASIWDCDEGRRLARQPDPEQAYLRWIRPEKIRLQLEYVRRHSLLTDLAILFQTARVLLFRPAATSTQSGGTPPENPIGKIL